MFALRDNGGLSNDVDSENATVKASQILRYGLELSQATRHLINSSGVSEADIRFAYPSANATYGDITVNPQNQVFSSQGGNAIYRTPPAGANDGSKWEFYADMALTQVGSGSADLYAFLPNLTLPVCTSINNQLGITTLPVVSNCPSPVRFAGVYSASPVSPTITPAPTMPMPQACISCAGVYNYYYTLYSR